MERNVILFRSGNVAATGLGRGRLNYEKRRVIGDLSLIWSPDCSLGPGPSLGTEERNQCKGERPWMLVRNKTTEGCRTVELLEFGILK